MSHIVLLWIVANMALCIDSGETEDHWENFYIRPGVGRPPHVFYEARIHEPLRNVSGPICPTRGSNPIQPKRDPHVMRLGDKVYVIKDVSSAIYIME